MNYGIDFLEFL